MPIRSTRSPGTRSSRRRKGSGDGCRRATTSEGQVATARQVIALEPRTALLSVEWAGMSGRIGSMRHTLRWVALATAALVTIGCDRATKHAATALLAGEPGRSYLADTVRLGYAENTGGFLSLGADWPRGARIAVFTVATGFALVGSHSAAGARGHRDSGWVRGTVHTWTRSVRGRWHIELD